VDRRIRGERSILVPPESDVIHLIPVPQIPGGLAVSIVGIINGAINGIFPQLLAFAQTLGLGL
jgi:hypothetical protein